jgi:hypothetical protein
MACIVGLPPLENCDKSIKITFSVLRGIVSDVLYLGNTVSFNVGQHGQMVTVYNYIGDQWLKNGMMVEVDFDKKEITELIDEQD